MIQFTPDSKQVCQILSTFYTGKLRDSKARKDKECSKFRGFQIKDCLTLHIMYLSVLM